MLNKIITAKWLIKQLQQDLDHNHLICNEHPLWNT